MYTWPRSNSSGMCRYRNVSTRADAGAGRQSSWKTCSIAHGREDAKRRGVTEWMRFDAEGMSARISSGPSREQIILPVQEGLTVELSSQEWRGVRRAGVQRP